MKYKIYKQFTKKIDDYEEAHESLSKYLLENGIVNMVHYPKLEADSIHIKGQIGKELNFRVEFFPTFASWIRKDKNEMYGDVYFDCSNEEISKKAKDISKLLIDYEL